jgi:Zn-finger nucleic acid-binding protein
MKAGIISRNELSLELKYCERCGGLWLRPVGGGQIYCVDCGRAMAELPPASYEVRKARVPRGPLWEVHGEEADDYEEEQGIDVDTVGGVA